jgi:acyl CoA:acetate/3-ketoacid CoA transferase alpha subunit
MIAIQNTVGKLQSDAMGTRVVIGSKSVVKIVDSYATSNEASNDAAQVLSSNEIRLQIIDEGMQLTQTIFISDEDEEEEQRRRRRALITK